MSEYKWPLFWPNVNKEGFLEELSDTFDTKWIGQGPKVDQFEKEFAEKFNTSYSVAVNSGSSALSLAYALAGIHYTDKVISSVLTCTATNHMLLQRGANILFADIESKTLNINPYHIDHLLKYNRDVKAIVAVHLGGDPCSIGGIRRILEKHGMTNIPIICDSAQALGATYDGKDICDPSQPVFANCFSFQAIKHITTGDGGMLCLNDDKLYKRAKKLRWFDIDREAKAEKNWKPWVNREITIDQYEPGWKYQMTDVAACLGLVGLRGFTKSLEKRRRLVDIYRTELEGVVGLTMLRDDRETPNWQSSHWLFGVLVQKRDDFCEMLEEKGIESNIVQVRNDIFSVFGKKREALPNMNYLEDQYTYLPLHTELDEEDVEEICDIVKEGW